MIRRYADRCSRLVAIDACLLSKIVFLLSRMSTKIDFCGATGLEQLLRRLSEGGWQWRCENRADGGGSGNGGGYNNQQRAAETAAAAIASSGGGSGNGGGSQQSTKSSENGGGGGDSDYRRRWRPALGCIELAGSLPRAAPLFRRE